MGRGGVHFLHHHLRPARRQAAGRGDRAVSELRPCRHARELQGVCHRRRPRRRRSNYTGGYSGTGSVTPTDPPIPAIGSQADARPTPIPTMGLARSLASRPRRWAPVLTGPRYAFGAASDATMPLQALDPQAVNQALVNPPVSLLIGKHSAQSLGKARLRMFKN